MLPVAALSYAGADAARLATRETSLKKNIGNRDCHYVIAGDWLNPGRYDCEVYHRFNPGDPFRHPSAVAFDTRRTFSKHVYAYNDWFRGLQEWIRASNLTPCYLNSYLKNALNAHIHVVIPGEWYDKQKRILENICNENLIGDVPVQKEYLGVKLIDDKGQPISCYETMADEVVSHQLRNIMDMMSGEGTNQGKLWASIKWGAEGWKFEEMPGKFKEYFESVISYDQRADQVILAGKGISSSITNVDRDGQLSKSGSEVYYNYLIYVQPLNPDEDYVCREINRAISLNFPEAWKQGIRPGFWVDIPAKLQDTSPADRPAAVATANTKSALPKNEEQEKE
jgi:hypothetical protein